MMLSLLLLVVVVVCVCVCVFWLFYYINLYSASEMTYIVSGGALNSTHSLTIYKHNGRSCIYKKKLKLKNKHGVKNPQ